MLGQVIGLCLGQIYLAIDDDEGGTMSYTVDRDIFEDQKYSIENGDVVEILPDYQSTEEVGRIIRRKDRPLYSGEIPNKYISIYSQTRKPKKPAQFNFLEGKIWNQWVRLRNLAISKWMFEDEILGFDWSKEGF